MIFDKKSIRVSFLSIFLVVLVAGCQTAPVRVVSVDPVDPPGRVPPAEAMVECQRPGPLSDPSFGAVVRKLSEALGLLEECESKRGELEEFIRGP